MKSLNKLKNEPYMAYLRVKRKLGEWYSEAPRPLSCASNLWTTTLNPRRRSPREAAPAPTARLARPRQKMAARPSGEAGLSASLVPVALRRHGCGRRRLGCRQCQCQCHESSDFPHWQADRLRVRR